MKEDIKRLFFGLETQAPWSAVKEPKGRHIEEAHRHLTLAFLGHVSYPAVQEFLTHFPTPPFHVGFVGFFDACLFLPERHPHVVAWHAVPLEQEEALLSFRQLLTQSLQEVHLLPKSRHNETWLPHITLCRQPFSPREWHDAFHPLPWRAAGIHLYESLGHPQYESRWSYPLIAPFEEVSHTADLAFRIRGETLEQIRTHAAIALAFHFPPLLKYLSFPFPCASLNDVVMQLNDLISHADTVIGCPFKAISYHGDLERQDHMLQWEMIVDV